MFGLKLPTDPRWVDIAEKNIEEILIDHAWCEQKAASSAISMIVHYPEKSDLVEAMLELSKEELDHFQMVHKRITDRGLVLGKSRRDEYVRALLTFFPKDVAREHKLTHELLISALIEARSCERFRLLSEQIQDKDLSEFYHVLMVSEANHYTLFLNFARQYGDREVVDAKWQSLLEFEAEVMKNLKNEGKFHG
ncbi:MAG: tRNA-(ms[2]io[6]A)-hydroxylase [Granulosicoccus sp.]|jgi:tRNA-(ms[2]io[6]A)-hydroxylase